MTDKEKLEQISLSLEKFQRTGDAEHLEDVERILEYDGKETAKESLFLVKATGEKLCI